VPHDSHDGAIADAARRFGTPSSAVMIRYREDRCGS
jgi:hypothetical protein